MRPLKVLKYLVEEKNYLSQSQLSFNRRDWKVQADISVFSTLFVVS